MSLSINHPIGKVTSTSALSFEVQGGTPSAPKNINFSASSVIMPNVQQPVGQSGSIIFDKDTKRMKYYDGIQWISWLPAAEITDPILQDLSDIYQKLNTKVDSVIYNSSSVPSASISGSTLYITFPTGTNVNPQQPGLFTSLPPGSITQYSLISGQTPASIREQMGGSVGSQNGKAGTQTNPYVTSTGWCYADGNYWVWNGPNGSVVQKVPNLNQNAYLKAMSTSGITKTDGTIATSGSIGNTTLSIDNLPPHSFTVTGTTNFTGSHVHIFPLTNDKTGTGRADGGSVSRYDGDQTTNAAGDHSHTVTGSTNVLGSGLPHGHSLDNVDVTHFNVAMLYNIAQPSLALNQDTGDGRYVLKSGDVMTGTLTIASSAILRGNDSNLVFWFRDSSNNERAVLYHNSTDSTLRLRANGGNEIVISNNGSLSANTISSPNINGTNLTITGSAKVANKNVTLSVNNILADANGNIAIPNNAVTDVRLGALTSQSTNSNSGGKNPSTAMAPDGNVLVGTHSNYNDSNWELDTIYSRPIQKQINGVYYTVGIG